MTATFEFTDNRVQWEGEGRQPQQVGAVVAFKQETRSSSPMLRAVVVSDDGTDVVVLLNAEHHTLKRFQVNSIVRLASSMEDYVTRIRDDANAMAKTHNLCHVVNDTVNRITTTADDNPDVMRVVVVTRATYDVKLNRYGREQVQYGKSRDQDPKRIMTDLVTNSVRTQGIWIGEYLEMVQPNANKHEIVSVELRNQRDATPVTTASDAAAE